MGINNISQKTAAFNTAGLERDNEAGSSSRPAEHPAGLKALNRNASNATAPRGAIPSGIRNPGEAAKNALGLPALQLNGEPLSLAELQINGKPLGVARDQLTLSEVGRGSHLAVPEEHQARLNEDAELDEHAESASAATAVIQQIRNGPMDPRAVTRALAAGLGFEGETRRAAVIEKFVHTIPYLQQATMSADDHQFIAIGVARRLVSPRMPDPELQQVAKAACDIVSIVGTDPHEQHSLRTGAAAALHDSFAGASKTLGRPAVWIATVGVRPVLETLVRGVATGVRTVKNMTGEHKNVSRALDLLKDTMYMIRGNMDPALARQVTDLLCTLEPSDSKHLGKVRDAFMAKATPEQAAALEAAGRH